MPGLALLKNPAPDGSENQQQQDSAIQQQNQAIQESQEENATSVTPREITQTDRLNKNLLSAFLNRLNTGDCNNSQNNLENKSSDNDDEWNE